MSLSKVSMLIDGDEEEEGEEGEESGKKHCCRAY
jgi:hypothetical protein